MIYKDKIETVVTNNPPGEDHLNPKNFEPFPKCTTMAKFFIQLGMVYELGCGVLNVSRLIKQYAGKLLHSL
jgi:predicted HTH transcriptional regulator